MNDSKITRRQVLVLGGLTLGVGAVTVPGLSGPAWADSAADVVLVPVGASPVAVLPGVGVQPAAFPRQLAVQVKHAGADLPAGTEVALTYDPRLYSPCPWRWPRSATACCAPRAASPPTPRRRSRPAR